MKHIELAIKPTLIYLLRGKFIEYQKLRTCHGELNYIGDKEFYKWLFKLNFISEMEYKRLINEENDNKIERHNQPNS